MPSSFYKQMVAVFRILFAAAVVILAGFGASHLLLSPKENMATAIKTPEIKQEKIKLFDDAVMHRIDLNFDQTDYWKQLLSHKKIADSLEVTKYLPVDIIIDGKELGNSGIRFKGESSFDFSGEKKKSFKLVFNKFEKGQKYQKVKKLHLNNFFKDPTFMRDKLYLEMQNELGLPTQRSAYTKVFINGAYWGMYLMIEQIDKRFVKRHFNESSGSFFKGEPNALFTDLGKDQNSYHRKYQLKSKTSDKDWNNLVELIQGMHKKNLSDEAYYIQLDNQFEVDDCLRSWALNNTLVNIDAYNMHYPHNFYIYQNSKDKKFNWINYDGNYSFGAWSPNLRYQEMVELPSSYPLDASMERPLLNLLMDNTVCQSKYQNILKDEVLPLLEPAAFTKRVDELKTLIASAVYADDLKLYSNEQFDKCIETHHGDIKDPGAFSPGLKEFAKSRFEFLTKTINQ